MLLAEVLPRTKQIASRIFDFPEPFGPTMAVKPLETGIDIRLLKDLNP
jgi:hypothetical protein